MGENFNANSCKLHKEGPKIEVGVYRVQDTSLIMKHWKGSRIHEAKKSIV